MAAAAWMRGGAFAGASAWGAWLLEPRARAPLPAPPQPGCRRAQRRFSRGARQDQQPQSRTLAVGGLAGLTAALISGGRNGHRAGRGLLAEAGDAEGKRAAPGDRVVVHYEGRLEDGTVLDTTVEREPVRFQLGKGQVIRGLERLVLGLRPGEAASAELPPEAAYGQRREELLVRMPAERAPAGLEAGMSVTLQNGRGKDVPAQVVAVADDGTVTCDTNHALAGRTLSFRVELLDVEELLAPAVPTEGLELATFAAGSFWSLELAFQRVPGVAQTSVGYSQGRAERPSFEDVASGRTGHVQAVRVVFDPHVVTFEELLSTFWSHLGYNATTRDVCGEDSGPMYRSGIYYHSEEQRRSAEVSALKLQMKLKRPVVTEVQAAAAHFWLAEHRHQRYLERGGRSGRPQSAEKGCVDEIRPYG